MEQEQYEEEVKVVLFPDRQEVTSDDLTSMPDVVRERVRHQYAESLDHSKSVCLCHLLYHTALLVRGAPGGGVVGMILRTWY